MNFEKPIIRLYNTADFNSVLELFDSNCPKFFDESEKADFIFYLENGIELYYVLEIDNKIIGCGGINFFQDEKLARISWDMLASICQGKGFGKLMLEYRLNKIKIGNFAVEKVVVRTSQHVFKFYEKCGFELLNIVENYWAKDFHLYEMNLIL